MDGFNRFDLNSMPKVRPGVDPSVMVNVRGHPRATRTARFAAHSLQ
jgi:hypothetical protein